MGNKIIITERQRKLLESFQQLIAEGSDMELMVEKIKAELDANYEPMIGVLPKDGEYHKEALIKVKANNEPIAVKNLFNYLKDKYKFGDEFTRQIISDWMFGEIKDNRLSKNVSLY